MLERILEPEVMDSPEEARDYDSMDHRAVNMLFVGDFLRAWDGSSPILDVGTGTGQIPFEFCRQSARGEIVGIDLAEQMLELARQRCRELGLQDRIEFVKANARQMPYGDEEIAAVMSNSIVHHIPAPIIVFQEMVRVARPGALLFVRDLLRPDDRASLDRLVNVYADAANLHQRQMFAASLHAALALEEVRDLAASLGFERVAVQQTSDRHWTFAALRP